MCKIKIYIFTTERSRETCLIQVVIDYWTSQLRYSSIFIFNIKIFKYLSFCFCIITIKLFIQLLKIVSGLNSNIDKKTNFAITDFFNTKWQTYQIKNYTPQGQSLSRRRHLQYGPPFWIV